jgi:hypothetical protein
MPSQQYGCGHHPVYGSIHVRALEIDPPGLLDHLSDNDHTSKWDGRLSFHKRRTEACDKKENGDDY